MITEILQWFYDGFVAIPVWLQIIIGIGIIIYLIITFENDDL